MEAKILDRTAENFYIRTKQPSLNLDREVLHIDWVPFLRNIVTQKEE